ncbi:sensor histidine kinase [Bacillus sp. CGMCC 1.16607]|uniref:sensor histidine kinase n=1 Tax=Bacillus sp. CGMCC 1.16607 TaxID=3351842 RepID=UPI003645C36E
MKLFKQSWVDHVFTVIRGFWFLIWMIIFIYKPEFHQMVVPVIGIIIWLITSYVVPQFIPRKKIGYPILELGITGSLYVYLFIFEKTDSSILLIPAVILGFNYSKRFVWWGAALGTLLIPLAGVFLIPSMVIVSLTHILNNAIAVGLGFAFNRMVVLLKRNEEQYMLIQEQNKALELYAQKVESLTLLQERDRMAKEIHDTMGHTFTSVIIGMDGVTSNIQKANYDKALERLRRLRKLTKEGLDEIRKNIHDRALDEEDTLLSETLTRLAKDFGNHTNTVISIRILGQEYEVPLPTKLTLIRCLQETLTNAKNHGEASVMEIKIDFQADFLAMKIKDNGIGMDEQSWGFGLMSMKERIERLQGEMTIHSEKGIGTELVCYIPRR